MTSTQQAQWLNKHPQNGQQRRTGWEEEEIDTSQQSLYLHQPRTVCLPQVMTYSLFWFFPGITSNFMDVSPIPWFLKHKHNQDHILSKTTNKGLQLSSWTVIAMKLDLLIINVNALINKWKSNSVWEKTKYICPTTPSWSPKRHKQQMWIKEDSAWSRSAPSTCLCSSGRAPDKQQQWLLSQHLTRSPCCSFTF